MLQHYITLVKKFGLRLLQNVGRYKSIFIEKMKRKLLLNRKKKYIIKIIYKNAMKLKNKINDVKNRIFRDK